MDFPGKCDAWFNGLTPDRQEQASCVIGLIPDWMVVSLREAGIPVVPAEVNHDGKLRRGFLLATALTIYLSQPEIAARPVLVTPSNE